MKRFNMMVAKPYFDKQANMNKTKWVKIGTAVEMVGNDGQLKIFGDIDSTPTFVWDGSFQLFEQEDRQQQPQQQQGGYQQQQQGGYQQQQQPEQQAYNPQQR